MISVCLTPSNALLDVQCTNSAVLSPTESKQNILNWILMGWEWLVKKLLTKTSSWAFIYLQLTVSVARVGIHFLATA